MTEEEIRQKLLKVFEAIDSVEIEAETMIEIMSCTLMYVLREQLEQGVGRAELMFKSVTIMHTAMTSSLANDCPACACEAIRSILTFSEQAAQWEHSNPSRMKESTTRQ